MSKEKVHTLEDIARLANVSRSTVSRALNNSPLISQRTRERIQAIAREYHFRKNAPARNLRLRQSHTVAFIVPDYSPEFLSEEDFFGRELLSGIGKGLSHLGYDLLIVHASLRSTSWVDDYLNTGRVDGFILKTSHLKPAQLKALVEKNVPFIGWGTPVPDLHYCSVSGDNVTGGRLATRHLIRIGRKKIAFVGGVEGNVTVQQRFQGYESALQEAGRSVDPKLVTYTDYSFASGSAAMQRLLEQNPDLDAVFVNSDLMAIAAIQVIQACGKRVPEDIAVIGYDDLPIALYNTLPLTTIRQDLRLAGKLLAENLIQFIQTGVVTHVTLPVELVLRKTA